LLFKNIKIKTYRTIILLVVLYGYEAWSLILREECRLREFENRVQRRIFGPKRDEVTGKWRKPHNEEFNDLYSSGDQKKKNEMAGGGGGAYRVLVEKPEGKRPLGRPKHRWEDNRTTDLQ
jgi:hypothetical protein